MHHKTIASAFCALSAVWLSACGASAQDGGWAHGVGNGKGNGGLPPGQGERGILDLQGEYGFAHDPTIVEVDGKFHVFHTSNLPADREGLIYWRSSPDLVNWTLEGAIFDYVPGWALSETGASGLWAPDAVVVGDEIRVYYSASSFGSNNSAIGLVTAKADDLADGDAEWTDRGLVYESETYSFYNAIDPAILVDKDGRHWMSFGSYWTGVWMIELDPATGKVLNGAGMTWLADRKFPPNAIEAPDIVYNKQQGYYYLFVSKDACCQGAASTYNVVVGRSERPQGPYLDRDGKPLMADGGTAFLNDATEPAKWAGPGHNALIEVKNQWYTAYHSYDTERFGFPELRIRPVFWDKEGWPYVVLEENDR